MKALLINLLFTLLIVSVTVAHGQQTTILKDVLEKSQSDTSKAKILLGLSEAYMFTNPDSCMFYGKQAAALAHKLGLTYVESNALNRAGEGLRFIGDFPSSLDIQFKALNVNRSSGTKSGEAVSLTFIGALYMELNDFRQGLNYMSQANKMYENLSVSDVNAFNSNFKSFPNYVSVSNMFNLSNMGDAYEKVNILDSALSYQLKVLAKLDETVLKNLKVLCLTRLGNVRAKQGNHVEALNYYHEALKLANSIGDKLNDSQLKNIIAEFYKSENQRDSSLHYARLAYVSSQNIAQKRQILIASNLLVRLFKDENKLDSVIHYQDIAIAMNDSLHGPEKLRQLQLLTLKQQQEQQEILQEQERHNNRIRLLALLATLGFFLVIAVLLYRNNRQKHKANVVLQEQKDKVESTLSQLKATQAQLIQSEKLASLGELTVGIAHEIQNPLNFVNNFSELSVDLANELKEEIDKIEIPEKDKNYIGEILTDLSQNQEKINHHGKRASSIVKGMLEHSRASTGVKELTDINKLADEYLRLSYHGLRAKDKDFNADFTTDFDENLPKIEVIPQDIGRVVMNLINNAFYAVTEKKKADTDGTSRENREGEYQPTVIVSTQNIDNQILIKVNDNGMGMPESVRAKVFQPFFTTKPTGSGTGLGLSLAYDIVTKGHGGTLEVISTEGVGSAFIITLPFKTNV